MRALLIPVDGPVREVDANGLEDFQRFVGGCIETVPFPRRDDVVPFFNEEGKLEALPVNIRATALLRESIFPSDYIAGDLVLAGFDPETGENLPLPEDFGPDCPQMQQAIALAIPLMRTDPPCVAHGLLDCEDCRDRDLEARESIRAGDHASGPLDDPEEAA